MTAPDLDQAVAAEGHPTKADGSPYAFGGYAFLRLGCRCTGCQHAQDATAAKAGAARKSKGATRAGENLRSADNPVSAVLSDVTDGVRPSAPKTPPGGASARQVEQAAAQILVYVSIAFVWAGSRGLPLTDEQTDRLALADDEAQAIARPLARAFAGSDLNSRYGRQLVDNSDVLEALFVGGNYIRRTTQVLTQIRRDLAPRTVSPVGPPHPTPTGGPNDSRPVAQQPDPGAGAGSDEPFSPPRPSYQPYEPGAQLGTD